MRVVPGQADSEFQAHIEGMEAFSQARLSGAAEAACPYGDADPRAASWRSGWSGQEKIAAVLRGVGHVYSTPLRG